MTTPVFQFASLGSGSDGNTTVIQAGDSYFLLDCGFSMRETIKRLARLDIDITQITAILVTHEHGDHIKGMPALNRKYRIPVYMTRGTRLAKSYGELPVIEIIEDFNAFTLGGCRITPVAVPHDAKEPAQFTFEFGGLRLGILTDIGFITPHVVDGFDCCDALLVEANHDLALLSMGPYPQSLKTRVSGNWGHLNNLQTADFLQQINLNKLKTLVIGHISQKNNCIKKVSEVLEPHLPARLFESIKYACQDEGFGWISL